MNRLVAALLRRPEVVATATELQRPTFQWLADTLGEELLNQEERARIAQDAALSSQLEDSYLHPITAQRWNEGVQQAQSRPAVQSSEWVTMVPAAGAEVGLTVPDGTSVTDRISLFTGPLRRARRISVELAGTNLSVSVSSHCNLPIDSWCDPGECGGCRLVTVEAPNEGLICLCDD